MSEVSMLRRSIWLSSAACLRSSFQVHDEVVDRLRPVPRAVVDGLHLSHTQTLGSAAGVSPLRSDLGHVRGRATPIDTPLGSAERETRLDRR